MVDRLFDERAKNAKAYRITDHNYVVYIDF